MKINKKEFFVFDNGGRSIDNFTIVFKNGDVYGCSHNPFGSNGFAQSCGNIAWDYYAKTVGVGFIQRIETEDKPHFNKLMRQATREQVSLMRNEPDWLGREVVVWYLLPESVKQYITQLCN